MGPAATLGLGRFAYALLLPPMRADLGWSYADAGLMNTANAAGYLLGAVASAHAMRTIGIKHVFAAGVLTALLTLAATGATRHFALLMTLRFATGAAGALTFVAGATLTAAAAAAASRATMALGIYFAGPGIGIIISALTVPALVSHYGWAWSWIALALMALVALTAAIPALIRAPLPAPAPPGTRHGAWPRDTVLPLLASYGVYGAGYISYMTFIVAYLRSEMGFGQAEIMWFWLILGIGSVTGAYAWGHVLARTRGTRGMVLITGLLALASVLPLFANARILAYASAALFGCVFLSVVTAVTAFARQVAPPHAWAAAIGLFTVMFAAGQCVGPVLTGLVSDGAHGVRAGLWLSGGILGLATAAALLQRQPAAGRAE